MSDQGHYRCYIPKKFTPDHEKIIQAADHIITEYENQGFKLSVRQIYYQFVQRNWLANQDSEYDRLGDILSAGRLAGLISWTAIEDRNRNLMGLRTYDSPKDAVQERRDNYHIDKWADQPFRPEVWGEKASTEGVIGAICDTLQVDYFSCRGYNSQSEQWRAGQRFARYIQKGQQPIVFHLGDHDPSGWDMTRDNTERLAMFAGTPIMVQRLALNMPQIEEFKPPPQPVKKTDGRWRKYAEEHGTNESWELDSMEPKFIQNLIETAVLKIRDEQKWDAMLAREVEEKRLLDEMIGML